ncbi:hypothetical protein BCM0100_4620 [Bacillus cereus]|nr:hypothetical protein BCM0100_4620 [Bacillus cereus]
MGRVKIYQRLLEYIDRNSKYISDYWNISTYRQKLTMVKEEGVPTYWHTLVFHND